MLKQRIINLIKFFLEFRITRLQHPPGHFYSPIVDKYKLKLRTKEIFTISSDQIPGIELHQQEQLQLLNQLVVHYPTQPFTDNKQPNLRYYFNNDLYCHSDAIFLQLIMRHFKPQRIIEVGSGFSSAVMLDTNELFFDNQIKLTFIEPYPTRLQSLFKNNDSTNHTLLAHDLQSIDISIYKDLQENDILFIDSTHVSKTGSDVNKILFEILPQLNKGVLIHFHDIFYPFEYPPDWVLKWSGFGWNENYILKAFLMHNDKYKIKMFNTYLEHFHKSWFVQNMPECLKNEGGSIWLQKQ